MLNTLGFRINVSSGVPQGKHLGLILFLFFINDIPSTIQYSNFLLYADDVNFLKSYASISERCLL